MSLYTVTDDMYREGPAGTPGWQHAPVPGWGTNPYRAGPRRVGVGEYYEASTVAVNQAVLPRYAPLSGCGCSGASIGAIESDQYNETTWGHVMLAAAGGIVMGVLFGYAWWQGPKR